MNCIATRTIKHSENQHQTSSNNISFTHVAGNLHHRPTVFMSWPLCKLFKRLRPYGAFATRFQQNSVSVFFFARAVCAFTSSVVSLALRLLCRNCAEFAGSSFNVCSSIIQFGISELYYRQFFSFDKVFTA